jgi:hypothetical protein
MISFATIVMIGWIPLILVSFSLLAPRRAVITAYLVGWMFLPILSWDLPGLPQYDKTTATNLGVLAAILLFDTRRLARFRPGWVDLPLVCLCLCPSARRSPMTWASTTDSQASGGRSSPGRCPG